MLGAVLTGGDSRRMGTDKALLMVDGRVLAGRVADALVAGGADPVLCIGGDLGSLGGHGLRGVIDLHPGSGPLGGVLTALSEARRVDADLVAVSACDHPDLTAETVALLRDALTAAVAGTVVAVAGGPAEIAPPLVFVARVGPLAVAAEAAFGAGERSLRDLYRRTSLVRVIAVDPASVRDVDHPADLHKR